MVDYTLNPLGGFNLGQGIRQLGADIEAKQEKERLQKERQEFRDATLGAAKGDPESIERLMAINPQLGMQFEQRQAMKAREVGEQQAAAEQAAFNDWGIKYASAKTPEEKQALEQEALNNPLIDFDESDIGLPQNQKDMIVNTAIYKSMGKDAYNQFFSEGRTEKGVFQIKETPSGFVRLNSATGEVLEIPSDSKIALEEKKKSEAELKRQLDLEGTTFDRSRKLRDEYSNKTKEFDKVDDAFDRVKASMEDPDAAGDLALIFNYMKMLDPGSVVREGEFATAQNAAGVPTQVRNLYGRILNGERLSESQRSMFGGRAEKLYRKALEKQKESRKDILDIGKRYKLTEEDIFGSAESAQAQSAPQAAIDYLIANPQLAEQFKAKYGYLPEGF